MALVISSSVLASPRLSAHLPHHQPLRQRGLAPQPAAAAAPAVGPLSLPRSPRGSPALRRTLGGCAASRSAHLAVVASQGTFADETAAKFVLELPQLIKDAALDVSDSAKVAQICAKPLKAFLQSYSGELAPEPFAEMKEALQAQGVAKAHEDRVVACALGWARANLYSDWRRLAGGK